jgi:methyltransferase (TIGR00027 family)
MKATKASKTAQYMALFRALETARPSNERLFNDPYAIHFLDAGLRSMVKLSSVPGVRNLIRRYIQKKIPGGFSSGLARTRYIDDQLYGSIRAGVKQLVILGAGFDTRAVRLSFMETIPTIEIDHPNTSNYKLRVLRNVLGIKNTSPVRKDSFGEAGQSGSSTIYCQIDFNKESLDELAGKYGIDFAIPTTIIWEGVTNYLSADAVDKTFRWISKFAAGSHVIFTYVNQDILDHPENYFGGPKLLDDLLKIEERWTFGLKPENVSSFLAKYSMRVLHDLGAAEYRKIYIPERSDRGYEFYRVAVARK